MMEGRVPTKAWVVTFAGMALNLCLGILYAWSVWKKSLLESPDHPAGSPMTGLNEGWSYLSDSQATWAYALCGFIFACCMIPGGRIQDRFGPKLGAMLGGMFLAAGCFLAGWMKSYSGLILGFGVLGGIGMGLGYAAATPAAVRWFGPHQRGLIVGLVVGGFGAAAMYIAPLSQYLIDRFGISGSFYGLGMLFAVVVISAGSLLSWPPTGYVAPASASTAKKSVKLATRDWRAGEMLGTPQFFGLVFLFIASAQSGLLVIANAVPILTKTAGSLEFFAKNGWILASFGGLVNAIGRIGTGFYSDRIGRKWAYWLNAAVATVCVFATPTVIEMKSVPLLFLVVGVAFWQYGGGLSLLPAFTADFFGAKNLGFNYGLVFLGWGLAFFMPQIAGVIKDRTGSLDIAFYISGSLLLAGLLICPLLKPPKESA
jgi:OFA family oxalate/formate antiporter-like MFS transporter